VTVAGLLLAAGAGSRLGQPKALVTLGGTSLLARGIAILTEAGCDPVIAVLGAAATQAQQFAERAMVVVADDWAEGLGATLRAGLRAVAATAADTCVITLVDEPLLTPAAITHLLAQAGPAVAAVATYGGVPGQPVLLRRAVWEDVARMAQGDVGARAWLRAHPDQVARVNCDGLGQADDIDTTEDLARLQAELPSSRT
jgi:CTP:molybdopterin cytidylyltransferase MocA